jgi:cell division protein ZapA
VSVSEVYICGSKYRIKSDEDEAYIEQVASYVSDRMKEFESKSQVVTTSKIAVMTAFSIADELIKLKKAIEQESDILDKLEDKLNLLNLK